jgi:regulator of replication initiation timing
MNKEIFDRIQKLEDKINILNDNVNLAFSKIQEEVKAMCEVFTGIKIQIDQYQLEEL